MEALVLVRIEKIVRKQDVLGYRYSSTEQRYFLNEQDVTDEITTVGMRGINTNPDPNIWLKLNGMNWKEEIDPGYWMPKTVHAVEHSVAFFVKYRDEMPMADCIAWELVKV